MLILSSTNIPILYDLNTIVQLVFKYSLFIYIPSTYIILFKYIT